MIFRNRTFYKSNKKVDLSTNGVYHREVELSTKNVRKRESLSKCNHFLKTDAVLESTMPVLVEARGDEKCGYQENRKNCGLLVAGKLQLRV